MPKYNTALDNIPLSAFDTFENIITEQNNPQFIRLHQGKTVFQPCFNLKNWQSSDFELLAHQHASPLGINSLKNKIANYLTKNYRREVNSKNIMISCGATHAIGMALKAILEKEEEVLVLSPQWLFAVGLVHAAGGIAIEVPIFLELSQDDTFDFITVLEKKLTKKTKAIYFNSPNNPTGYYFKKTDLEKIAEFAKEHDLWIISDNAYEIYHFDGKEFIDISQIDEAKERTFSVHTFSKTYAMPGYRIGYVISPTSMAEKMNKWGLYSVYSVSTTSQFAAHQVLDTPIEVLFSHVQRAKDARDLVTQELKIPHTFPSGSLYTFINLSFWKRGTANDFLTSCIQQGVSLAPGIAFGNHCENYARLCFTAAELQDIKKAILCLNKIYEE